MTMTAPKTIRRVEARTYTRDHEDRAAASTRTAAVAAAPRLLFVAFFAAAAATTVASAADTDAAAFAAAGGEGEACRGGTCPFPSSDPTPRDGVDDLDDNDDHPQVSCGLWLGPSPIKEHHEHGFGLGMFTGLSIAAGTRIDPEILIPVHDKDLDEWDAHPPLREYVWDGDNVPEVPLEAEGGTMLFLAGVASLAPCTSKNFNLALRTNVDDVDFDLETDAGLRGVEADHGDGVHRSAHPGAGSYSYRHSATFVAVRDIVPGEELTVECSDDDFDGGAYELYDFEQASRQHGGDAVVCLDDRAMVRESKGVGGRGLFARKKLEGGSVVTSTPLIPIARDELDVIGYVDQGEDGDDTDPQESDPILTSRQLLLNYCFGHPDSDLLLLPNGPLVNALNHPPRGTSANVEIRWHDALHENAELPRRQQHHHPELLDASALAVAETHGKGLVADIVALRDIAAGEELYLDYGAEWTKAWGEHVERWNNGDHADEKSYVAPIDVERSESSKAVRTVEEQKEDGGGGVPYPTNIQTVCHYAEFANEWNEAENNDEDEWSNDDNHPCLAPCAILERYSSEEDGIEVGGASGEMNGGAAINTEKAFTTDEALYLVEILPTNELQMTPSCHLDGSYHLRDAPRSAVRFADKSYESDVFLPGAFRREMGAPDGFYPETWMNGKKKSKAGGMRWGGARGGGNDGAPPPPADDGEGEEFKRRKSSKRSAAGMGTGLADVDLDGSGRIS